MSYPEQPISVRFTKSREEVLAMLQELAQDPALRARFASEPDVVLADFGIEVTPADAIPRTAVAPSQEDLERAIEQLTEYEALWPWIALFPWIGFRSMPEKGDDTSQEEDEGTDEY